MSGFVLILGMENGKEIKCNFGSTAKQLAMGQSIGSLDTALLLVRSFMGHTALIFTGLETAYIPFSLQRMAGMHLWGVKGLVQHPS